MPDHGYCSMLINMSASDKPSTSIHLPLFALSSWNHGLDIKVENMEMKLQNASESCNSIRPTSHTICLAGQW